MSAKQSPPGDQTRGATATKGDGKRLGPSLTVQDAYDCWLCGEPVPDWSLCDRCRADLAVQLRRRREAASRLQPLEDVIA